MARDNHDSFLSVDFRVSLRFTTVSATQTGTTRKKKHLSSPESAAPPQTPASAPAALNDVPCPDTREASLSPTSRQLQRRIRMFYHQHLEELKRLEEMIESPRSTGKATLSRAAEMDRHSLQTLEAASAQVAELPLRPSRKAPSTSKLQARTILPTRQIRSYQGTTPYETPSSATGTNLDVHSIPTNLPTTPTYSNLFRSKIEELLHSVDRSAGRPSHPLPPSPTFQQALDAQNVQRPAHTNVEGWLWNGTAGTSQGSSVQFGNDDALLDHVFEGPRIESAEEDALENIEQVASDQLEEDPVLIKKTDLPEEQAYGAGHSSDSWSEYEPEKNDDHADESALAQDALKKVSPGSREDAQDWEFIGSDSGSRTDSD